jgi:hypothetical protein
VFFLKLYMGVFIFDYLPSLPSLHILPSLSLIMMSSLYLLNADEEGEREAVSMLITPEDVTLLFDKCGDASLSTRKQVHLLSR